MGSGWDVRCPPPRGLVRPVPVDPSGMSGPTVGQAKGPRWRRSSPRLYVPAAVDRTIVEQRILEAAELLPPGGVVTGWAALRPAGGGYFDGRDPADLRELPVPLLVPADRKLRARAGILVIRRPVDPGDTTLLHGIPCARPERAICDEVRRLRELRGAVRVLDMAYAARVTTPARLGGHLRRNPGTHGIRLVRRAFDLADPRSRSPQEVDLRLIWQLDAGLPRPRMNWPVADDGGRYLGKPDLLCPELGVYGEFDGADHRSKRRHRIDVRRHEDFRRVGLEGFVLAGEDLRDTGLVVDRMLPPYDAPGSPRSRGPGGSAPTPGRPEDQSQWLSCRRKKTSFSSSLMSLVPPPKSVSKYSSRGAPGVKSSNIEASSPERFLKPCTPPGGTCTKSPAVNGCQSRPSWMCTSPVRM